MPIDWSVETALGLAGLADCGPLSPSVVEASVEGYSTPSVVDVGGASLRIRFADDASDDLKEGGSSLLASQGSVALCIRRAPDMAWLPAVAGVPGHHADSEGKARHGLLEAVVLARPTVQGGVTFLHDEVLREWAPIGTKLHLAVIHRVDDFHIDDGSGPWLRDRICITASQAEDYVAAKLGKSLSSTEARLEALLEGTGLRSDAAIEGAPEDEWDLTRRGNLHRDVGLGG